MLKPLVDGPLGPVPWVGVPSIRLGQFFPDVLAQTQGPRTVSNFTDVPRTCCTGWGGKRDASETRARRETRVKRDAGLQGWFVAHFNPFGGSILRDYVGYIYIYTLYIYIYIERERGRLHTLFLVIIRQNQTLAFWFQHHPYSHNPQGTIRHHGFQLMGCQIS